MTFGQVVVSLGVLAFFGYELYAVIRDFKKKAQAKKELQNETEKDKKA